MKKIIFICTGNTCRSPMAMAFFNSLNRPGPQEIDYVATSAGLAATDGDPASTHAVQAVKELWKMDLSGHSAHMLSRSDIGHASLLLTMTQNHKEHLLAMFPQVRDKVFTLKEYAYGAGSRTGLEQDISDPYGGSLQEYLRCAEEISLAVELLVEKLKKV